MYSRKDYRLNSMILFFRPPRGLDSPTLGEYLFFVITAMTMRVIVECMLKTQYLNLLFFSFSLSSSFSCNPDSLIVDNDCCPDDISIYVRWMTTVIFLCTLYV